MEQKYENDYNETKLSPEEIIEMRKLRGILRRKITITYRKFLYGSPINISIEM